MFQHDCSDAPKGVKFYLKLFLGRVSANVQPKIARPIHGEVHCLGLQCEGSEERTVELKAIPMRALTDV
jgi:hypothetical protein